MNDLTKHDTDLYKQMLTKFFGQDMENWAFYIKEISEEDDDWIQKVTLFVDILPTLDHTEILQVN